MYFAFIFQCDRIKQNIKMLIVLFYCENNFQSGSNQGLSMIHVGLFIKFTTVQITCSCIKLIRLHDPIFVGLFIL